VRLRLLLLLVSGAALFAQSGWQTAYSLPAVDFSGLTNAQRAVALQVLRSETCVCGCNMKVAQCRMEDPGCFVSRRLAALVVNEASSGKSVAAIHEALLKFMRGPELLLEAKALPIPIDGDPVRGPVDAKVTIVEFSDFQ